MLGGQVVQLGAVDVDVVELPLVVVEVAPAADRRVGGDGLPAVVPDAARPEHRVELGLPLARGRRVVEAVAHAHAVEVALGVALDRGGRLDAQGVEHGRHQVDRVVVLLADLALGLHPGRPRDDARVGRAAVELVALPHLEGRVEGHRPPVGVVVVGLRAAELVEHREVGVDVVGDAVHEQHLVDRPVRAALAAGPVVGDDDDHGVLALAGLLEVVEQPPDLRVGVRQEARRRPRPSARTGASRRPRACPRAGWCRPARTAGPRGRCGSAGCRSGSSAAARCSAGRCPSRSAGPGWSRASPRSPRRSGRRTSRSTPWGRGAARGRRPGRSRGRRACPGRRPSRP